MIESAYLCSSFMKTNSNGVNNMNEKYQFLTHAPVHRVIGAMALPTIISMLLTSVYNLVDTFFCWTDRHAVDGSRRYSVQRDVLHTGILFLLRQWLGQLYFPTAWRSEYGGCRDDGKYGALLHIGVFRRDNADRLTFP